MGRKNDRSQERQQVRGNKLGTSWRIINPNSVVPAARPSARIQAQPITINLTVNARGGSSNNGDYDDLDD